MGQIRKNSEDHTIDSFPILPIVALLAGSALSLYGSLPKFDPIRATDAIRPLWGFLHTRENFTPLQNRSAVFADIFLEQSLIPSPPREKMAKSPSADDMEISSEQTKKDS